MVDKNQALVDYILTCQQIYDSPLYFNFANIKNGIHQFITLTSDKNIQRPYIDGSVKKMYSLTIISYLTISNNPVVKVAGISNENITDMNSVQSLIDWIAEQERLKNYPNFGDNCIIEKISTTTDNPRLDRIDATQSNPLARYSFTIQVEYIDNTDNIWNVGGNEYATKSI